MVKITKNYEHLYLPVENTGPMLITKFLDSEAGKKYEDELYITEPCVFYPLMGNGKRSKECVDNNSYAQHVWANTWTFKEWYKDPIIFNARYWVTGLIIIFLVLWLWCYNRRNY